jgi:molecular chaperone GrpE
MTEKDVKDSGASDINGAETGINSDENMSSASYLNEPVNDSESDKLKEEIQESKDRYLRLAAEFDNFKRRTARERIDLIQSAGKDIIKELLDVLDDSERAQKQLEQTDDLEQSREGVKLVFNKLRTLLQSKGLKAMEAVGVEFNPDLHEAITEIPAPTPELQGKVVDQVTRGYYLNDKILRHAKVVVGS